MVSFLLAASFAVSAPPGKAAVEDDAKLLNIALSYVADNDWDMALYVLDKIKNESSDPQLKLKATVWKVVVLRSLAVADGITSSQLDQAYRTAYGDDKVKLCDKMIELLESVLVRGDATIPELEQLLAQGAPRKVTLEFPPPYELITEDTEDIQILLDCGRFPGELAIKKMTSKNRSFCLPYLLEKWTGDESLYSALFKGNAVFDLDLAKVYLEMGRYFKSSTDAQKASLSRRCLEEVLRLTEDDPYCKERLEALKLLGR